MAERILENALLVRLSPNWTGRPPIVNTTLYTISVGCSRIVRAQLKVAINNQNARQHISTTTRSAVQGPLQLIDFGVAAAQPRDESVLQQTLIRAMLVHMARRLQAAHGATFGKIQSRHARQNKSICQG